ncbi:MAG: alpha-galactosidase [Bacteroidales bacterium]|jgi:alpha-galactosidase|nr:alpha-galactosidase [Bacteroidales bacterium]
MRKTVVIFLGIFLFFCLKIQAETIEAGNYRLEIDAVTGKYNIYHKTAYIVKNAQLLFKVGNTGYSLTNGTVSSSPFQDATGRGTRVRFSGKVNNWEVIQNFYLYGSQNYILTDFSVETTSGAIASNYMAPLKSMDPYTFLPDNGNRVLMVPFDNDDFIRYESNDINRENTSYEVTALYNEDSRNGLIIGSVEHDTWKTGIVSKCSDNRIRSLEIYGGIATGLTRDHIEHGKVNLKKIKSPKIFIGYYADWRDGLEDFGKTNRLLAPKYYAWEGAWKGKKPFGWNSWAALESKVNYSNSDQTGTWIAGNIQNRGFVSEDQTLYIGLDSYWNESGFNDQTLKAFVDRCHARGQKAGVYLVPFSHWGGNAPPYALKAGGQPRKLDGGWCIDPTHPDTKSRTEKEFLRRIKQAGFDYIKIDFLGHGAMEADSWFDPTVQTGIQAYNHGMRWLADWFREHMPGMYVNLSIAPVFPGQYAHSRRISCDAWNKMYSDNLREGTTEYVLNSLNYGWWLDHVYDYNDADHILLNGVSEGENRARITSSIITGIVILGDDYSDSGNSEIKERSEKLLTRKELNRVARQCKSFRPVNSGNGKRAANQFVSTIADTTYLAVFNFGDGQNTAIDFERIGLIPGQNYNVRDLWRDYPSEQKKQSWTEEVPQKDVKLLKIFKIKPNDK